MVQHLKLMIILVMENFTLEKFEVLIPAMVKKLFWKTLYGLTTTCKYIFSYVILNPPFIYSDVIDGGRQEAGSYVVTELEKLICVTCINNSYC